MRSGKQIQARQSWKLREVEAVRSRDVVSTVMINPFEKDASHTEDSDSPVGVFRVHDTKFSAIGLVIHSGRHQARGWGYSGKHGS